MDYNTKNLIEPEYNRQELSKTWSECSYEKYKDNAGTWRWEHLPNFNDKSSISQGPSAAIDGSILEIGSAAGGAYDFLSTQNVLEEEHDYSGFDISKMGNEHCKAKYPSASWHLADLTRVEFDREYDYAFERIAVHHMPNPLEMFAKILAVTQKSFTCTFVSCLNGGTISDLSLARYRHGGGEFVYFDIINVFEVMEIMLEHGFNNIGVFYGGEHERVYSDPLAHQYLSPEINFTERLIGRTTLTCNKSDGSIKTRILNRDESPLAGLRSIKRALTGGISHLEVIEERLLRFNERSYGVLYKTAYQPL